MEFMTKIALTLISLEAPALWTRLSRFLVERAVKNLPLAKRDRVIEEVLADLASIQGPISKLINLLDFLLFAAPQLSHQMSGHRVSQSHAEPRTSAENMGHRWRKEEVELLRTLWFQGQSTLQIANQLGVSPDRLRRKIHRLGLAGRASTALRKGV